MGFAYDLLLKKNYKLNNEENKNPLKYLPLIYFRDFNNFSICILI
jgi:hypothetical protein